MISLSRYGTELSPGILASIRGTSDRASLPAAYSQSRQNIGRVISISAICSCACIYVCVYLYTHTHVCMSGWHKRTGRCAVSFAFAWSARKEFGRVVSTPRGCGRPVGRSSMHMYMYVYVYTGIYSATYEVCHAISAWRPTASPGKETSPLRGGRK